MAHYSNAGMGLLPCVEINCFDASDGYSATRKVTRLAGYHWRSFPAMQKGPFLPRMKRPLSLVP